MREIEALQHSLDWIRANFPTYNERRLDFRGGFSADSMPEHVSGSSEPSMLEQDDTQKRIAEDWQHVRAGLERTRIELRGIESRMAFVVNTTKRPEDPPIKVCANQHCPDSRVFSMVGRDRPQDSTGRCDPCRQFYKRNQRERTSINAYRVGDDVEVVQ